MNETGTNASIRAETVPMRLIAMRARFGAHTPAGRRISNIREMLKSLQTAQGDRRAGLAKNITEQMADLERLAQNAEH